MVFPASLPAAAAAREGSIMPSAPVRHDAQTEGRLLTRRERRRLEMTADIIATARKMLRTGGMNAISLRAIAGKVGVTPAAIYRYFPDLGALACALQDDVFNDLRAAVISARDRYADDGSAARLQQMAKAMREWALDHPAEFGFSLGPGYRRTGGPVTACGEPAGRIPELASIFFSEFTGPLQYPSANSAFLAAWVKLYGLAVLESSGDLRWMSDNTDTVFGMVLAEFVGWSPMAS
jgi:AcrR family transcriptional regulator